jgi:hypothetical protein
MYDYVGEVCMRKSIKSFLCVYGEKWGMSVTKDVAQENEHFAVVGAKWTDHALLREPTGQL